MVETQASAVLSPPGFPTAVVVQKPWYHRAFSSQLRINVASGLATTLANVLVLAASYPLYLYFLGYQKVGVWLLLSSVQVFAQLGLAGVGPVLTKLVAEERGRSDNAGAQQYISLCTMLLLAAGAVTVIGLMAFRAPIIRVLDLPGDNAVIASRLLSWVGLLTAFSFLNQVTTAGLAGIGRIDIANYFMTAGKVAALFVEATLLWKGVGVVTLLIGDFVGCATIHVLGQHYLKHRADLRMVRGLTWDKRRLSRLMNFGGSMFVASLTTILVSPLNKIALSHYFPVTLVPVYDIAFNGSMQVRGLAETALRAIMPAVSFRGASNTPDARRQIRSLHTRAFAVLAIASLPAYGLALLVARPMLRLWLGARFVPEIVPTFEIMLAAALINLAAVPAYYTLMGTGRIRSCMVSHLLSALANVLWLGVAIARHRTLTIYDASFAILATMTASSAFLLIRTMVALWND